jgi:hypothetical protein
MTTRCRGERCQAALTIETTETCTTISLLWRHGETCVTHPERPEDSSIQHRAQWRTIEARDQEAEQIS